MLAGDETHPDEVTSGVLVDEEPDVWCQRCDHKLTTEDGPGHLCRDCAAELGEAGA